MKPGESLVIMGFLVVMLLILFLLGHFARRSSTREKFIFSQKIKNIDWRKTFKYWFFIQGFKKDIKKEFILKKFINFV